jgi:hypothetical protein
MTHDVEIIDFKQLSDGQVAVLTRCCGDDSSRSWHTMASSVVLDDAARAASIGEHVRHVATLHETTTQALAKLPKIVGSKVSVSLPTGTNATTA